jgi:hypothetical protein
MMTRTWRAAAALILAGLAFALAAAARAAESGVEGLAALRGDFVAGVVALAFTEPGAGPAAVPVAVSAGTDESGRYRIPLKPGTYYLAAVKSSGPPWPFRGAPGDLYCYYLGNPIVVEPGKMTRVGFNMVRIGAPLAPVRGEASGISGRILFEDKPLGRAYVYIYRDVSSNFRGIGLATMPADEQGRFRLKLPPGRYYVLARKRQAGGMYGPPGKDDFIGYYPGNPVEVRPGEFSQIALETTTRVDLLEQTWFKEGESAGWFEGVVTDAGSAPVPGVYVLFYANQTQSGAPSFVAGPTDAAGRFRVRAAAGTFHLLARSALGGPIEAGEWYGKTVVGGGEGAAASGSGAPIRIQVSRYPGK